jgi:hypothetical protein
VLSSRAVFIGYIKSLNRFPAACNSFFFVYQPASKALLWLRMPAQFPAFQTNLLKDWLFILFTSEKTKLRKLPR